MNTRTRSGVAVLWFVFLACSEQAEPAVGLAETAGGAASGSPSAGATSAGSSGAKGAGAPAVGGSGGAETTPARGGSTLGGSGGQSGSTSTPVIPCELEPADPQASSRARNLLCYLKTHTNVSGQTDMPDGDAVEEMTGRYPAIIAFDFYRYTDGDTSETQKAIDFFEQKNGIVAFQWHWKAPITDGEYYTEWDFQNVLDDPNHELRRDIQVVVAELKKMGDAGVPVLFRPLHECNNDFMWWAKRGADNYRRLWKLIYDEAQSAGAHDLVWVFNGMASGQSTAMSDWYPGDDSVDVISSDYFQSHSDYDSMKAISGNKVLAVAETFDALRPDTDPPFSYFVVWASRDWGGKGAEDSWKSAMASDETISLQELPDMSQW